MSQWINDLLDMTEEVETPKSFIFWAGLAAISAVVKKKVWLNKHVYKLYPNIFVMLVAPSGGRKGFGIWLAKALAQQVGNCRIISGRTSIQAILQALSTATTSTTGPPITDASCLIASSEFASSLIDDPQTFTILTDLYDTHAHEFGWKNTLKGTGTEELKDVCITMISASNPTHLQNKIPEADVNGGFVGRTVIVAETKKRLVNSLITKPKIDFDFGKLVPYLKQVASVTGEFTWTQAGATAFDSWYVSLNAKLETGEIIDETGTADRVHDQVLKVAMLLSLSESTTLTLDEPHITEAINLCTSSAVNVRKTLEGTGGKSQFGRGTKVVLGALLRRPPDYSIQRSKLLRNNYGEFDAQELDRIVETLKQAGAITVNHNPRDVIYQLTPKFLAQYNQFAGRS